MIATSAALAGNAAARDGAIFIPNLVLADLNGFVADNGAANRVIAGDMLRSLSQEIPAAVCHLHNDVDVAEAAEVLEKSVTTFDVLADALLHGNEDIGIIGAEERRKTAAELDALIEIWNPIHDAALRVLADPSDAASAQAVYASNDMMLEKTSVLLSHIEGQYSHPTEILQSDVMLLEVSGRMAALNQRLAYEACRVWSHEGDDEMRADLLKTMAMYEGSQDALTNGMQGLGIMPPPNAAIADKLAEIGDHWGDLHDQLVLVSQGNDIAVPDREVLYHDLIHKLHQIEELEVLYQEHSKRIF